MTGPGAMREIEVAAALVRLIAPILVFTGEEIWKFLPKPAGEPDSVHMSLFPQEAELRQKEAEYAAAEAQLESARANFEEPIQRQAELADAEAQLAKVQTELNRLPALLQGGQAKLSQAEKELQLHAKSQGTASRIVMERAQRDLEVAQAAVDEYREQLKSEIADFTNTGGRPAGSITAALFLQEFSGGLPWAHLGVAGTAWAEEAKAYLPKGPSGVAVRTLAELAFSFKV